MSDISLQAQRREPGRSTARSLRRQGIVPGVFYFHGEDSIPLAAHELALRPLIQTAESHLINLKLDDGTEKLCILKDMTFDPITDRPTHFDLMGVAAGESIRVSVPVVLSGRAAGQLEGGLVQHILHELDIECLPKDLPEHIVIDITPLAIGNAIHVSDLSVENVSILTAAEATVVSVSAPRVTEEETISAGPAEPEVIAKGKKEEE